MITSHLHKLLEDSYVYSEVAQTLLGVAPSASTISRLNQTLTQQFEAWRQRPLQEHWRIVYLDGVHFSIRHGEKADATIILTALGVDLAGNKEVLALRACAEESKDGWTCLLQDLRRRGATQIDLIVTDGHDGLLGFLRRFADSRGLPVEQFSIDPPLVLSPNVCPLSELKSRPLTNNSGQKFDLNCYSNIWEPVNEDCSKFRGNRAKDTELSESLNSMQINLLLISG